MKPLEPATGTSVPERFTSEIFRQNLLICASDKYNEGKCPKNSLLSENFLPRGTFYISELSLQSRVHANLVQSSCILLLMKKHTLSF